MEPFHTIFEAHDILIKYIGKKEYANQLAQGGLFMHTPKYYREQGMNNISMGDPKELDDLYPIWCVSIFQNNKDFVKTVEIDNINRNFKVDISFTEDATEDIVKALLGFVDEDGTKFQSLGNYAVIIFDAAKYIGGLVEGFSDLTFKYVDREVRSVPIECGKVSYGHASEYHPKLFKADKRFEYQHEYRIRLGLNVSLSRYDVPLDLGSYNLLKKKFEEIKVYTKEDLVENWRKSQKIQLKYYFPYNF